MIHDQMCASLDTLFAVPGCTLTIRSATAYALAMMANRSRCAAVIDVWQETQSGRPLVHVKLRAYERDCAVLYTWTVWDEPGYGLYGEY